MLKLLFLSVAIVVLSERLAPSLGASAANIRGMSIRDIRDSAHTSVLYYKCTYSSNQLLKHRLQ